MFNGLYKQPPLFYVMVFRRIEAWRIGFYMYFFLVNIGFGMYLTISRDMVNKVLGYDYSFMSLIVAAENIPLIFSIIGGGLSDVIGRRVMVLAGCLSSIPLLLMGYTSLEYLPLLASLYIFFWSLAQPAVTGALLHASSSSGIHYSIYALFGTIGWGLGGPVAGIIISSSGWRTAWLVTGLVVLAGFLTAYILFPKHVAGGKAHVFEIISASRIVLPYFISSILCMSGFLLFYGNYSLVLRGRISDPSLYGLVYTFTPAIAGIVARPFVGLLSERIDPRIVALMGVSLYLLVIPGLYYSYGLLMVVLWAIPLYPFIDQGFVLTFSRSLPGKLQSFASGIWGTSFSIGGIIVLASSFLGLSRSLINIFIISELLMLASLLVLVIYSRKSS